MSDAQNADILRAAEHYRVSEFWVDDYVKIARREEGDVWTIVRGQMCLVRNGASWQFEPSPSNRTDEFLSSCRYTLAEALDLLDKCAGMWGIGATVLSYTGRRDDVEGKRG